MKQSFSVLISDGESDYALFVAHCLAQCPNVKLYILCKEPWAPIQFSRYGRHITLKPNSLDDETVLNTLTDIIKKKQIDVLLPTGTEGISFVIRHKDILSKFVALPPLPDRKAFEIANNKWLLSQFLEEHEIPGPKSILINEGSLEKELESLEYPVLLKPTGAGGGKGVKHFESPTEIRHFVETRGMEKLRGCYIIQSFLTGCEVDFNVLSSRGKFLASAIQSGIIASTHKFAPPVAIEFIKNSRFLDASKQLFSALAWSGFAHVDTICDARDNKINVLDLNARFWASLRGSLVAGVNFPYLACLAALDIPFPPPDYELARYYTSKTALRERFSGGQGKGWGPKIAFQETGLRFLLLDPVAEILRGI